MPHEKVREVGIILGQQDVGQPLLHLGLHGRHGRLPGRHSGIAIRPGDGTGCAPSGTVTVNSVHCPTALSTPSTAPIRVARLFATASPSPSPLPETHLSDV